MNRKIALIVGLFAAFCAAVAGSPPPVYSQGKSVMKLADEYALALRRFQTRKSAMSIESLMRKGKAVAGRLEQLESLSDAEYTLFEKKMRGFVVNREEVLYVKPDSKFFGQLSARRGTKADIAFFAVMREIRPESVWTAYYGWQTDVTGCTKYGNGALTRLYGKALQFKRAYPKAYIEEIDEEINEILGAFTDESVCACGDRQSVEREFRLFIRTFPKDKNAPVVRERLANLEKNKANRFYCKTG